MDKLKKQYGALVAALAEYKNLAGQVAARMRTNRSNYPQALQVKADKELSLYDQVVNYTEGVIKQVRNSFGDELGIEIIAGVMSWLSSLLAKAIAYLGERKFDLSETKKLMDYQDKKIAEGMTPEHAARATEAVKSRAWVEVKAVPGLGSFLSVVLVLGIGYLILKGIK